MNADPMKLDSSAQKSLNLLGLLTFLVTMISMATVGLLVPLSTEIGAVTGLSKAEFGASLALFSLPSAMFSMIVGSLCDRLGARKLLFLGGVFAIASDIALLQAGTATMFRLAVFASGVGFAALVVGSPALIISRLEGGVRTRALSLWSTYAPVGVAAGLLLAAPFAGTSGWRRALIVHMVLLALCSVFAWWLLRHLRHSPQVGRRFSAMDLLAVFQRAVVLRLAIALAIPSGLSYGTSLIAPSYLNSVTNVSIASSAALVAAAKIVVALAGGLLTGWLVSRRANPRITFGGLVGIGIVGQLALFYPASGLVVSLVGLGVWLFAYAGIAAMIFSTLPIVFRNRDEMGAANGLLSQCSSILSFLAPIVYFWDVRWSFFPILCAIGVLIALALFPKLGRPSAEDIER